MNNEVKEIIVDLMTQLWKSKLAFFETVVDRNIFEAEMKEIYDKLDEKIGWLDSHTMQEYEEEIEDLEERLKMSENDNTDLIDRNYDLAQENMKLWERISAISKVVNDTWS